jgi:hypothetical protein
MTQARKPLPRGYYYMRLLVPWGNRKAGNVLATTGGVRKELLRREYAVDVETPRTEPAAHEITTNEPVLERAVISEPPKRKRGRPKGSKNRPGPMAALR